MSTREPWRVYFCGSLPRRMVGRGFSPCGMTTAVRLVGRRPLRPGVGPAGVRDRGRRSWVCFTWKEPHGGGLCGVNSSPFKKGVGGALAAGHGGLRLASLSRERARRARGGGGEREQVRWRGCDKRAARGCDRGAPWRFANRGGRRGGCYSPRTRRGAAASSSATAALCLPHLLTARPHPLPPPACGGASSRPWTMTTTGPRRRRRGRAGA
ncbi:hypothetical protein PVAP13_5NG131248 [Panicum virgatum]|uniref:Uncharacterized protein n=1 Tax=Panicum virgatum TaxID=38727 RepID=A0A8T0RKL0_PANVG|nr:hypothetical protein PVAP13_5NG131248 [Panicum virgatum]